MNNEIIKAMQKKNKNNTIYKWWRKNSYKVWRIIFFPIWGIMLLEDKITIYLNNKEKWNEKRANEILNYYIPRRAHWNDKEQCFYFFDNGLGWNLKLAKKYLKRKDRRFWQVNCGWWGGKMRDFMIEKFELEDFTKEIGNCDEGWTEISFYFDEKRT